MNLMKMNFQILLLLFSLWSMTLFAQKSGIENTRLSLSPSNDILIINYNLTGNLPAFNVKLAVTDSSGGKIPARSLTGDIGHKIYPGANKIIYWNMKADNLTVVGPQLNVTVYANVAVPRKVKKEIWIPWLYIAAAASAGTGLYANYKSNTLYANYPGSSTTDDSEMLHNNIKRYDSIRNIAFGAAGVLGVAGVLVHIRHNQKKNRIILSYQPLPDGVTFGLNYNF